MALVVEDGTAKTDANSYISVADADTYVAAHGAAATWTAATTAVKEEALRIATQYLDVRYIWKGERVTKEQALAWPRYDIWFDGYYVEDTEIPQRVRDAVVEAAVEFVNDSGAFFPDRPVERSIKREKKRLGDLEKEVEYTSAKPTAKSFPKIEALVRPFVRAAAEIIRG